MQQPLKNKTVLVTRAKDQAGEFISQLKKLGANTILLPLITTSIVNETPLTLCVKENSFDWIVFTSPNAVKHFFEIISPNAITKKIAVVGSKTKEALELLNLSIDFIPSEYTAKKLAKELPINEGEFVFIPRSSLATDDAVEILKERGGLVKALSIYENSSISYTKEEIDNIASQAFDYITFTSGSTVLSFLKTGLPIAGKKVICIGPETAKVAQENKLSITEIATPHNISGMIEAIKKSLTD